ncbi:hypothetical protein [Nonomuraea sp. NPDC050786]|uniref:hypothetical protein n=1 Tax=Nonomuraea sp. NPDC050786 TaxID=3154840 RepID=UPI00340A575E
MKLTQTIRTVARGTAAVMNTCLNPTCLHSQKTKGCTCCAKGHGSKARKISNTRKRK